MYYCIVCHRELKDVIISAKYYAETNFYLKTISCGNCKCSNKLIPITKEEYENIDLKIY